MNESIFRYLNGFAGRNEFFDAAIIFSAKWLPWVLVAGLVLFIFIHRHDGARTLRELFLSAKLRMREPAMIVFSAFSALALSEALKYFYISPRPFEILANVNLLFSHGGGDSFPSGHATFFAALAAAVYSYHKKLGIIYIIGALLIGLGRITAGIHFPIDILAGYILGGAIGLSVYALLKRTFLGSKKRLENKSDNLYTP